jgi:hypothetical protein
MSNGLENTDKDKDLTQQEFSRRLAEAAQVLGFQQQRIEPAPPDEEYGVFSSGEHADTPVRRMPKPSYRLQEEVAKVLLKAQEGVYEIRSKQALCSHLGLQKSDIAQELSQKQLDERILPMIARELPEGWDIGDVSSAEVARMRRDFLLDT